MPKKKSRNPFKNTAGQTLAHFTRLCHAMAKRRGSAMTLPNFRSTNKRVLKYGFYNGWSTARTFTDLQAA